MQHLEKMVSSKSADVEMYTLEKKNVQSIQKIRYPKPSNPVCGNSPENSPSLNKLFSKMSTSDVALEFPNLWQKSEIDITELEGAKKSPNNTIHQMDKDSRQTNRSSLHVPSLTQTHKSTKNDRNIKSYRLKDIGKLVNDSDFDKSGDNAHIRSITLFNQSSSIQIMRDRLCQKYNVKTNYLFPQSKDAAASKQYEGCRLFGSVQFVKPKPDGVDMKIELLTNYKLNLSYVRFTHTTKHVSIEYNIDSPLIKLLWNDTHSFVLSQSNITIHNLQSVWGELSQDAPNSQSDALSNTHQSIQRKRYRPINISIPLQVRDMKVDGSSIWMFNAEGSSIVRIDVWSDGHVQYTDGGMRVDGMDEEGLRKEQEGISVTNHTSDRVGILVRRVESLTSGTNGTVEQAEKADGRVEYSHLMIHSGLIILMVDNKIGIVCKETFKLINKIAISHTIKHSSMIDSQNNNLICLVGTVDECTIVDILERTSLVVLIEDKIRLVREDCQINGVFPLSNNSFVIYGAHNLQKKMIVSSER